MKTPRLTAYLVAFALMCSIPARPASAGDEPRIDVAADQTTIVSGTFDSLAQLLRELCTKAQVELRAYDAPDRPITAHHEGRPLADTIERLLSQENYLLGVREGETPGPRMRVAWIRVTGAKNSGLGSLPGGVSVPSRFGATDFSREDPADAQRAEEAVAARLLADDARVATLLQVDARELAQSLRQYPHIEGLLRKLRAEQDHPAVVEKLDAVIRELKEEGATPSQ